MSDESARTGAADLPGPYVAWQRLLNEDDFVTKGRQVGVSLPPTAPSDQVARAREGVKEWARTAGLKAIIDSCLVSEAKLKEQAERVNDLREQMPHLREKATEAEVKVYDSQVEQSLVGLTAPEKPSELRFMVPAVVFGAIFGLIGATTISSLLRSVWRVDVDDPASFYMKWAVGLGLFFGIGLAVMPMIVRRWAPGAGRAGLWGQGAAGLLFALGFGGFRLIASSDEEPGSIDFHLTNVGVALLFLELAILVALEVLNHIALHAWKAYGGASETFRRASERVKVAEMELERRKRNEHEGAERLAREYAGHDLLDQRRHFYEIARTEKSQLEEYVVQCALRGFDMGRAERQSR